MKHQFLPLQVASTGPPKELTSSWKANLLQMNVKKQAANQEALSAT